MVRTEETKTRAIAASMTDKEELTWAFHASSIRAKTLLSHLSHYQGNFLQLAELFFPLGVELTGYQSHGDKATCRGCRGKRTLWWWDVPQDGVLGVGAAFVAQGLCNSGPEGHFVPNAPLSSSCSGQLVVVTQCWVHEDAEGSRESLSCGATSLKLASHTARAAPNLSVVLNLSHLTMTETKRFPKNRLYG